MLRKRRNLKPLPDRGPLRVLFTITSMPVGGAETLLVNLLGCLDRERFLPELCCLKEPGVLAARLVGQFPTYARLLRHKYDLRILPRLTSLIHRRRIDAVITVGAGDKMFWGRLAAWRGGAPVIVSALHSTGWPDTVSRLNRWLTPITDAFIAVAPSHGRYLVDDEGFPADKVRVIPNGIDVHRFRPLPEARERLRAQLGIPPNAPVCGIVAALRVEKNHFLFLRAAEIVARRALGAHFLVVGDGLEREDLERAARAMDLGDRVRFLGSRDDIPQLLSAMDVFALTSHNEANPVSILEAMACGLPVVSTNVGSVSHSICPGVSGFLAATGDAQGIAESWLRLFSDRSLAEQMGAEGRRRVVENWSIERMVDGYQQLIEAIYERKCPARPLGKGLSPLPLAGTTR